MYAIVESGGKQVQVGPGDQLRLEKIDAEVGTRIELDKILMVNRDGAIEVGQPYLEGVRVTATVVEQGRTPKVLVFKKKRRKQYRRTRGHRQPFTAVRIESIER